MGAILAIFNREAGPVDQQNVLRMIAAAPQRSIDGQQIWIQESIALAHQHFWITPEEQNEIQPLEDSGCTITCFARLDNRAELTHTLRLENHPPLTDAYLILRSYLHWGVDCVEHLQGDFAFALWDSRQQTLFLARDALGIADLCYYFDQRLFLAASQVSQILAHPGIPRELNERKVCDHLEGYSLDQENSYFENIYYLLPAHCLLVSSSAVSKWQYWDVDPSLSIRYRRDEDYAEHFRELLVQAVQARLRTRGPVGISLSGGLDSTSIAAIIARLFAQDPSLVGPLLSFSYVFESMPTADERQFIRPLVEHLGIEACFIPADEHWTLYDLENWPVLPDTPAQDPFSWQLIANQRAASAAGCRVMYTGIFGDALYLGWRYWAADLLRDGHLRELVRLTWCERQKIALWNELFLYGLRATAPAWLKKAYLSFRPLRFPVTNPGLELDFARDTQIQARRLNDYMSISKGFGAPGQWMRYQALLMNGYAESLAYQRQVANAERIEMISPYLDRRLIEFILAIPAYQLDRPGTYKYILHNAMRGWLPEVVRSRTLVTSLFPLFEKGIREKAQPDVLNLLNKPQIVERGYVKQSWLDQEANSGKPLTDEGYWFWLAISLELWLEKYW